VAAFLLFCAFIPESLYILKAYDHVPPSHPPTARLCNPFRTIGVIISSKYMYLTGLSCIYILYCTAVTDIQATFVLYTEYRYNWNLLQVGLCYSLLGVAICVNQGILLKPYEKYLGLRKMLVWGFFVSMCGHLGYAFASKWWIFVVFIVVSSMGMTGHPAMMALMTGALDSSKRGAVLGAMGALQAVCVLVGGVASDNLFAYFISPQAVIQFPGPQFILGSFLFACAAISSIVVFVRHSEKDVDIGIAAASKEQEDVEPEQKPLLINSEDS